MSSFVSVSMATEACDTSGAVHRLGIPQGSGTIEQVHTRAPAHARRLGQAAAGGPRAPVLPCARRLSQTAARWLRLRQCSRSRARPCELISRQGPGCGRICALGAVAAGVRARRTSLRGSGGLNIGANLDEEAD